MRGLPRWGDRRWWRDYWFDVRPRMLWIDIRNERLHLRWGVPAWALEETVRALALITLWLSWLAQRIPSGARALTVERGRHRLPINRRSPPGPAPWGITWALLEGVGEGMLRLPPGVPFIEIQAGRSLRVRVLCL